MPTFNPYTPTGGSNSVPIAPRDPYAGSSYNDVGQSSGPTTMYRSPTVYGQGAYSTGPLTAPQKPGYLTPESFGRAPGTQILGDSNPGLFRQPQRPAGSVASQITSGGGLQPGGLVRAMGGGGMSQQGTNGGQILGSSVGPPQGYGAGLAPASGLGGGLYPSLVSLYR
jgi:hypothetical protein